LALHYILRTFAQQNQFLTIIWTTITPKTSTI